MERTQVGNACASAESGMAHGSTTYGEPMRRHSPLDIHVETTSQRELVRSVLRNSMRRRVDARRFFRVFSYPQDGPRAVTFEACARLIEFRP